MTDIVLAQAAYDAYSASRAHKSFSGDQLPRWEQLSMEIQDGWLAAVRAVATPADQAVRGVQAWMALDVHSALRKPVQAADHQGHPAWGDWWAELLDDVRAIVERQPAIPAGTPSPLCPDTAAFPDGRTVTCAKFADHPSPWHRRGTDSWRKTTLFGGTKGTRTRPNHTTTKDS